jgi:hypothetical protein
MMKLIDAFRTFVDAPKRGKVMDCYAEREGTVYT